MSSLALKGVCYTSVIVMSDANSTSQRLLRGESISCIHSVGLNTKKSLKVKGQDQTSSKSNNFF